MATTRIYKVTIQQSAARVLLVEASNPASAKRAIAETLVTAEVAGARDVMDAMRAGAEVITARDDSDTLGAPDTRGATVLIEPLPAGTVTTAAPAADFPPTHSASRKRNSAAAPAA